MSLPVSTGGPSLSDDEVTSVGEGNGVTVVGGAELNVSAGLVVLVVVLAGNESLVLRSSGELEVGDVGSGSGEGRASDGGDAEEESADGNHFDCF